MHFAFVSDLYLDIATPTWSALSDACEAAVPEDETPPLPDSVLDGEDDLPLGPALEDATTGEALLEVVLEGGVPTPPDGLAQADLVQMAVPPFLQACRAHAGRAMIKVRRYADRCGVWEVMKAQGSGVPMGRVLASFPPSEWERLRLMPLGEMTLYFGIRAVSEVSENLDDYL